MSSCVHVTFGSLRYAGELYIRRGFMLASLALPANAISHKYDLRWARVRIYLQCLSAHQLNLHSSDRSLSGLVEMEILV